MSSRRRRSSGDQADAFTSDTSSNADLQSFSDMLYSTGIGDDLKKLEPSSVRLKSLPIERIRPDAAQARRVMPTDLRTNWLRSPDRIPELLEEWLGRANAEADMKARPPIDVPEILKRDPENMEAISEDSTLPDAGPIETSFRAMLQLATSISHHGLTNAITVVAQDNGTYLLETGERRLLAFNLLHSLPDFVDGDWTKIPARVVEQKDIWRQAAENGARQDLNAVSMARQLGLLLMDIYQDKYAFARFSDMPGVEWYAQVYDSKKFPVPYGRGSELAAAMGLKSSAQIRQYRQLLSLPQVVWELADELGWTEYKIRELMRKARSVTTVTDSDEALDESLWLLAQYEAELISELPPDVADALGITQNGDAAKSSGGKSGGRRTSTVARLVEAFVGTVDPSTGTLTLHIDRPDVLDDLVNGEALVVTLLRPKDLEE